jgi:hypothetical protein
MMELYLSQEETVLFRAPVTMAGSREKEKSDTFRAKKEDRIKRKSCTWREFSFVLTGNEQVLSSTILFPRL